MKQIYDTPTRSVQLLFASIAAFLVMSLAGAGILAGISAANGFSISPQAVPGFGTGERQLLRLALLAGNLLPFAGGALIGLWAVYRQNWRQAAGFRSTLRLPPAVSATALFVICLPLVVYISWVNLQLPLPEWAVQDEAANNALLGGILRMESPLEFALAFLTIGVTPAIGEELLLRGVLQRRVLRPLLGNPHLAIWIAAAIFSAGHMEFAGFLPRLLLGAALGYAYYWTKSLWVPIVLHLLFNGLQVIQAYVTGEFQPDTAVDFVPPHWMGAVGLVFAAVALWYGNRHYPDDEEKVPTLQLKKTAA